MALWVAKQYMSDSSRAKQVTENGGPDLAAMIAKHANDTRAALAEVAHRKDIKEISDAILARVTNVEVGIDALSRRQMVVMDEANIATWLSDENGHCIFASRSLQEMVGQDFNAFAGMNWLGLFFPSDRAEVRRTWEESVNEGVPFLFEANYRHKSGEGIPVKIMATKGVDGKFIGVVQRRDSRQPLDLILQRLSDIEAGCIIHKSKEQ